MPIYKYNCPNLVLCSIVAEAVHFLCLVFLNY